jgi:iron complex outermembrane receptor protein
MRLIYIIIVLISVPLWSQNISGTIINDNDEPLYGITVTLQGTPYVAQTGLNGEFILANIPKGTYTLMVWSLLYSAEKQNIVVDHNNVTLHLQLFRDSNELKEVTITAFKSPSKDHASSYAAKLPIKNIENPQVINLVSHQIITQQAALDYNAVLKNIPGITKAWASLNSFYSVRGFNTRSYIRNGVVSNAAADLDLANLDQIQAIKGPSGTLFGSPLVSFGGVINRITKKPFDTTAVEIGYQGGSYELNRFTADVNVPLSKDKNTLLRLNASSHYSGSFQDAGFIRSTFLAPSLFYKINERLSFSLDAEIFFRESTSQFQVSVTGSGSGDKGPRKPSDLPLDYKRSYSNNTITLKDPTQSFYGQIKYKITSQWSSETNLIRTRTENTGNYLTFSLLKGDTLLARNVSLYPTGSTTVSQIQQNINGDFKIGSIRHRLLIGLDYYQNISNFSSNSLNARGTRPSFDLLNLKGNMDNYGQLSPQLIQSKLEGFTPEYNNSDLITYALYASDVLDITKRISAMLSLRIDRYINKGTTNLATNIITGNYNQTAMSPKLGLVYQIVKDRVSVFGNYMNGFQNVAPLRQPDGTLSVFKPQYANQFELGIKTELARDLLSATLSFYNIQVENTLRTDLDRPAFQVQEGTQYSKGIEIDIFSRPLQGLLFNAGFAYNDSRLTSANSDVNGLRSPNSGPDKTVNGYISYNLPWGSLKGIGIGFGGNYTDKNLIVNNRNAGQFALDSYTLLNSALFYNTNHYRLSLNIDNLANKQYYTGGFGTFTPGMLRMIIAGLTLKF